MQSTQPALFNFAPIGEIPSSTLRTEDLLSGFSSTLESLILINGDFYSRPENFQARDRLSALVGEAQDAWNEDGETLTDPDRASELVDELTDALQEFAAPYCVFWAHLGDGACFGFWPDIESAKESAGFVSVKSHRDAAALGIETDPDDCSHPHPDFRGEWLHVNDHGNCTLYVREENGKDREIWSVV